MLLSEKNNQENYFVFHLSLETNFYQHIIFDLRKLQIKLEILHKKKHYTVFLEHLSYKVNNINQHKKVYLWYLQGN